MTDHDFSATDPASLNTLDEIVAYLAAAFESGDTDALRVALAKVAESDGLASLAAAANLPRAPLADAMRAGEMSFDTTIAIMKVIDLHLP
jgi:probable addiction module antidote protein